MTLTDIENVAKELERTAVTLRTRVESMREDELPSIEVTSHQQMMLALQYLENFSGKLRAAHLKAREQAGKYGSKQRVRSADTSDRKSNAKHKKNAKKRTQNEASEST